MRWIVGGLMVAAVAGFAAPSQAAMVAGTATTAVESAREATTLKAEDVATRRRHRRTTRTRRPAPAPVAQ